MNKDSLYIIGNGFDLHHGINSRYSDFRDYLLATDETLYKLVTEYIPTKENWSDLEQALAETDTESITEYARQYLISYSADDWSDSYHHDYQYEINNIIQSLSENLIISFSEWIRQVDIPKHADVENLFMRIDKNAKFLSFNYTSTLSDIYGVPKEKILFIHGNAKSSNQEIVIGHAWDPKSSQKGVSLDLDIEDPRVIDGNEIINAFFKRTFKNTKEIIAQNKSFFTNLNSISNIYILGHSLSNVDIGYFEEIIKNLDNIERVQWIISFFESEELAIHQITTKKLGINDRQVKFCKLQELQSMKELPLFKY